MVEENADQPVFCFALEGWLNQTPSNPESRIFPTSPHTHTYQKQTNKQKERKKKKRG